MRKTLVGSGHSFEDEVLRPSEESMESSIMEVSEVESSGKKSTPLNALACCSMSSRSVGPHVCSSSIDEDRSPVPSLKSFLNSNYNASKKRERVSI